MPRNILPPNIDAALDPTYAKASAEHAYGDQLRVAREVCDYGAKLLGRLFNSQDMSVENAVMIPVLFRHCLAMLDATVLCLENGAVYAASGPLRSLLEASWSLEWLLRFGTADDKRCFYVGFVRSQCSWLRMIIPGTPEYKAFRKTGAFAAEIQDERQSIEDKLRADLHELESFLNQDVYKLVNAKFVEREGKRNRPLRDVLWYEVCAAPSPRLMARALGREEEYVGIYRSHSYATHGSAIRLHMSVMAGKVSLEPIRSIEAFRDVCREAVYVAIRVYRASLQAFRSGELEQFSRTYLERWRGVMNAFPDIEIEAESV